ncbi:MAG TPA: hypothetical protein VK902_06605 [Rubrobacter sp.]|nr:hypothetical protein [Rubrobacter sp.]
MTGAPRERPGEHPSSWPEFDHEVVPTPDSATIRHAIRLSSRKFWTSAPASSPIVAPILLTAPHIGLRMSPVSSLHISGSPSIFRMACAHGACGVAGRL